jgi:MFS family permease
MLVLTGLGAVVSAVITAIAGPSLPPYALLLLVLVFGFAGIGWTGIFMTLISELSGKESSGVGSAIGLVACNIGVIAGPPLFGFVVDVSHSYPLGWGLVALAAALGTAFILPVRDRPS